VEEPHFDLNNITGNC